MAPGLKWIVAACCGCIATALFVQRMEQRFLAEVSRGTEPLHVRELTRELRRARVLHEEVTRRDSAKHVLQRHETVIDLARNLSPANIAQLEKDAHTAIASIKAPQSRIGVFVMDPNVGAYKSVKVFKFNSSEYYAGRVNGEPYCAVVGIGDEQGRELGFTFQSRSAQQRERNPTRTTKADVLGLCRWWGEYGAPGTGIEHWFANGGGAFSHAPADWLQVTTANVRRRVFGRRSSKSDNWTPHAEACLAGRSTFCLTALQTRVQSDLLPRGIAAVHVRAEWPGFQFGRGEGAMLAHVEREFGREKFARFWHSDRPLEAAFADAFGAPLDQWVMQWARRHFGVEQHGPALPVGTLAVTMLTLGMLAAIAIGVATRRQPG